MDGNRSISPGLQHRARSSSTINSTTNEMYEKGSSFGVDKLLSHNQQYGIVVCRACMFAIQPSALPSHLLRHQIYRSERRQLLQRLSKLALLEPEDVPIPPKNTSPLPELSVQRGYKCEAPGCDHSCVSSKRMSQHWSERHDEHDSKHVKARPAFLQTFFRGNKIRYFEVNGPGNYVFDPSSSPTRKGSTSESSSSRQDAKTPTLSIDGGSPEATPALGEPTPFSLDMDSLRYFHHYAMSTSTTLGRSSCERTTFWQDEVVRQAFHYPFLMFGILGLAAIHLAMQTVDNASACMKHRKAAEKYQNFALAGFRSAMAEPDIRNSTALVAFSRFFGIQRTVQNQLEWVFSIPGSPGEPEDGGIAKLLESFFLLRGGHEVPITLQHLLPPDSDFLSCPEEMIAREREESTTVSFDQLTNIPIAIIDRLSTLEQKLRILTAKQGTFEVAVQDVGPAVNRLVTSFALSYSPSHDSGSRWRGAESWLRRVSEPYIHMLSAGTPAALVIFAYWCLLLQRLEEKHWFTRGQASRLQEIVLTNLPDEEWRALVVDLKSLQ